MVALTAAVALSCGSRTDIENFEVLGPPCAVPKDCTITPASCCGTCSAATRTDMRVTSTKSLREGTDRCSGAICEGCYQPADPTLVATCHRGHCAIVDLLKDSATACHVSSDCTFRSSRCCGEGASSDIISLNTDTGSSRVDELVCDDANPTCDFTPQAIWPVGATADCATGHCKLIRPTD